MENHPARRNSHCGHKWTTIEIERERTHSTRKRGESSAGRRSIAHSCHAGFPRHRHSRVTVIPAPPSFPRHRHSRVTVIPAHAGIQLRDRETFHCPSMSRWIPACAGMTAGVVDSMMPSMSRWIPACAGMTAGVAKRRQVSRSDGRGQRL